MIFIDNSKLATSIFPENSFKIKAWIQDENDSELKRFAKLLQEISGRNSQDVREQVIEYSIINDLY